MQNEFLFLIRNQAIGRPLEAFAANKWHTRYNFEHNRIDLDLNIFMRERHLPTKLITEHFLNIGRRDFNIQLLVVHVAH